MKIEDLKVGDEIKLLNKHGWGTLEKGEVYTIKEKGGNVIALDNGIIVNQCYLGDFVLIGDRANWHPHHDVIVAWAKDWKGLTIQHKHQGSWFDCGNPQWREDKEYRVKPEPDHTAEIADIERKMRELSESQKELADRLEKLK